MGYPQSPAILREAETIELDLIFPADPFAPSSAPRQHAHGGMGGHSRPLVIACLVAPDLSP